MKRIAVINGGKHTHFVKEALNPKFYELTEWEIIPLVGDYDLVLFFLEGALEGNDPDSLRRLRQMKKDFLHYTYRFPCKWVMFAPQDNKFIRRKGIMKNHNRCIMDGCKFGFQFKKRFRLWSSFPIESVLCSRNCVLARATLLHDPKVWHERMNEPMAKRQIELYQAYDRINVIPLDLIRHIVEVSILEKNRVIIKPIIDE
jgi:hypothetical protein